MPDNSGQSGPHINPRLVVAAFTVARDEEPTRPDNPSDGSKLQTALSILMTSPVSLKPGRAGFRVAEPDPAWGEMENRRGIEGIPENRASL